MKIQFTVRWLFALGFVVAVAMFLCLPITIVLQVDQDFIPGMKQIVPGETIYACIESKLQTKGETHVKCKFGELVDEETVLVKVSRFDSFRLTKNNRYCFSLQEDGSRIGVFHTLTNRQLDQQLVLQTLNFPIQTDIEIDCRVGQRSDTDSLYPRF